VAEFNRRNAVQLVIVDPEIAMLKVTATVRSDNIDGFLSQVDLLFGAKAHKRGDNEIVLRKGK
jgi:transmembrane sensor